MEADAAVIEAFSTFIIGGPLVFLTWSLAAGVFRRMVSR
jgi:hypothetical protein